MLTHRAFLLSQTRWGNGKPLSKPLKEKKPASVGMPHLQDRGRILIGQDGNTLSSVNPAKVNHPSILSLAPTVPQPPSWQ